MGVGGWRRKQSTPGPVNVPRMLKVIRLRIDMFFAVPVLWMKQLAVWMCVSPLWLICVSPLCCQWSNPPLLCRYVFHLFDVNEATPFAVSICVSPLCCQWSNPFCCVDVCFTAVLWMKQPLCCVDMCFTAVLWMKQPSVLWMKQPPLLCRCVFHRRVVNEATTFAVWMYVSPLWREWSNSLCCVDVCFTVVLWMKQHPLLCRCVFHLCTVNKATPLLCRCVFHLCDVYEATPIAVSICVSPLCCQWSNSLCCVDVCFTSVLWMKQHPLLCRCVSHLCAVSEATFCSVNEATPFAVLSVKQPSVLWMKQPPLLCRCFTSVLSMNQPSVLWMKQLPLLCRYVFHLCDVNEATPSAVSICVSPLCCEWSKPLCCVDMCFTSLLWMKPPPFLALLNVCVVDKTIRLGADVCCNSSRWVLPERNNAFGWRASFLVNTEVQCYFLCRCRSWNDGGGCHVNPVPNWANVCSRT